jgi:hypothetical protein
MRAACAKLRVPCARAGAADRRRCPGGRVVGAVADQNDPVVVPLASLAHRDFVLRAGIRFHGVDAARPPGPGQ